MFPEAMNQHQADWDYLTGVLRAAGDNRILDVEDFGEPVHRNHNFKYQAKLYDALIEYAHKLVDEQAQGKTPRQIDELRMEYVGNVIRAYDRIYRRHFVKTCNPSEHSRLAQSRSSVIYHERPVATLHPMANY